MRSACLLGLAAWSVVLAGVASCTGDDPIVAVRPADASADAPVQTDGGVLDVPDGAGNSDASDSGCAMRAFQAPVQIVMPSDFAYGPRFYEIDGGTRMLYVAQPGAQGHEIHEGAPAGPGAYQFVELVTGTSSGSDEWSPAPTGNGAFMVFARGPVGSRDLYQSVRGGGAFGASSLIADLRRDAGDDDADGFLLADGTALYFASNRAGPGLGLYRSTRAADSFAAPTIVLSAGTGMRTLPVVDGAESLMLFAESPTSSFDLLDVVETRLGGDHIATGQPMRHPELSVDGVPDAPAWLSPDGCTLYFQRAFTATPTVFVARR